MKNYSAAVDGEVASRMVVEIILLSTPVQLATISARGPSHFIVRGGCEMVIPEQVFVRMGTSCSILLNGIVTNRKPFWRRKCLYFFADFRLFSAPGSAEQIL
eukprot:gnl/TRDRNA2_/TRDRNA2_153929_c0_seq2.p2 gnl/TRDRNA2_/TRDRNA2_153929_c0~~gnl/TRDRNA2_/TRDRNA2_153929_c0_seq2.p2  ORF type:complete len:102 (+),score=3.66 gnl/TRDRNA2_/TRDRNA2_153929_c0_seq2:429-734(+)